MPLSPSHSLLFDLDGTLVDSGPLHDQAYRRVLQHCPPGLLRRYRYDRLRGKPTREALALLGVAESAELDALTVAKQRVYRELAEQTPLDLLPGARKLLGTLTSHGFALFLVSSGSRGSVLLTLRSTGLDRLFSGVITFDDVSAGKPSAEPYRSCLLRFGLKAQRCVAIEDSEAGVVSAQKAGIPVFGVHERGIESLVDQFFPSLRDLEQWLLAAPSGEVAAS